MVEVKDEPLFSRERRDVQEVEAEVSIVPLGSKDVQASTRLQSKEVVEVEVLVQAILHQLVVEVEVY